MRVFAPPYRPGSNTRRGCGPRRCNRAGAPRRGCPSPICERTDKQNMKLLHDKRRTGVLALLTALLGAGALFFGLGAAEATTPCTNTPGNDATVDAFGLASAGISTESTSSFTNVWVCATPPGTSTEANVTDPNSGTPGRVVYSRHCNSHLTTCTTLVNWTGAEVAVPSTSTTTATSRPGG